MVHSQKKMNQKCLQSGGLVTAKILLLRRHFCFLPLDLSFRLQIPLSDIHLTLPSVSRHVYSRRAPHFCWWVWSPRTIRCHSFVPHKSAASFGSWSSGADNNSGWNAFPCKVAYMVSILMFPKAHGLETKRATKSFSGRSLQQQKTLHFQLQRLEQKHSFAAWSFW